MIFAYILIPFCLSAFDRSYLHEQFTNKMLTRLTFRHQDRDSDHLNALINVSTALQSHIVGDINAKHKHEYIFWYKDLQVKYYLVGTLWKVHSRNKITFDPENKFQDIQSPLDNFLGDAGKQMLYSRITICKQQIVRLTTLDNEWLVENRKSTEAVFPLCKYIYYNFLLLLLMEKNGYYDGIKINYQENIHDLLQALPIQMHDIPSVKNYIQNNNVYHTATTTDEHNPNIDSIPAPYSPTFN